MCHNRASDIFQLDELGYNRMEPFEVAAGQEPLARKAARLCPERAITVEEG